MRAVGWASSTIAATSRCQSIGFIDGVCTTKTDRSHPRLTSMPGETDLQKLISSMSPRLNPGVYVWASLPNGPVPDSAIVTVAEEEGLTVVLPAADAFIAGLDDEFPSAWITLEVNSALEAVGLTAAFASVLGDVGIPCNVVAGFHHDHLFVPYESRHDAMEALAALAEGAQE